MKILFAAIIGFVIMKIMYDNGIPLDTWHFWTGGILAIILPLFVMDVFFGDDDQFPE